jgi:hypothetical protein
MEVAKVILVNVGGTLEGKRRVGRDGDEGLTVQQHPAA